MEKDFDFQFLNGTIVFAVVFWRVFVFIFFADPTQTSFEILFLIGNKIPLHDK